MKKQKITTLLLTMALCASAVLSGCAASAASQTEPNQSTTSSTPFEEAKDSGTPISSDEASSVQAYENDEVLSSEEQAKAEQERRAEIAEKYSIYVLLHHTLSLTTYHKIVSFSTFARMTTTAPSPLGRARSSWPKPTTARTPLSSRKTGTRSRSDAGIPCSANRSESFLVQPLPTARSLSPALRGVQFIVPQIFSY